MPAVTRNSQQDRAINELEANQIRRFELLRGEHERRRLEEAEERKQQREDNPKTVGGSIRCSKGGLVITMLVSLAIFVTDAVVFTIVPGLVQEGGKDGMFNKVTPAGGLVIFLGLISLIIFVISSIVACCCGCFAHEEEEGTQETATQYGATIRAGENV